MGHRGSLPAPNLVKEIAARAVDQHERGASAAASHRQGATDMVQTVFSCSIARHAGDVDVEVIGAMDRSSAGQFRNQLLTIAKEHPASIAIDMDDLALVDSSCVAVLVEAWRFMAEHGIALRVKSPAASIRQVFDVADSGLLLTLRH
jgi:anti-anti-sigma factor